MLKNESYQNILEAIFNRETMMKIEYFGNYLNNIKLSRDRKHQVPIAFDVTIASFMILYVYIHPILCSVSEN